MEEKIKKNENHDQKTSQDLKDTNTKQETEKTQHKKAVSKKSHSKVKELERVVEEQKKTIEDLKKSLMWLRSDYENYKNYSKKEIRKVIESANEKLIAKLLAWIDNFERALNHLKEIDEDAYKGFNMIFKSMIKIFEDEGLKQINPKGEKFDVFEHEAVDKKETDEVEEWTIVDVVSNGYKLRNKLIKPAKVVVAVKPKEDNKKEQKGE